MATGDKLAASLCAALLSCPSFSLGRAVGAGGSVSATICGDDGAGSEEPGDLHCVAADAARRGGDEDGLALADLRHVGEDHDRGQPGHDDASGGVRLDARRDSDHGRRVGQRQLSVAACLLLCEDERCLCPINLCLVGADLRLLDSNLRVDVLHVRFGLLHGGFSLTNIDPVIGRVDDHQQIDEHRREQEPKAEVAEGVVHALDLADHLDRVARLELLLEIVHHGIDVGRDTRPEDQKTLFENIRFAENLGAHVVRGAGRSIADGLAQLVRENHITQVIFGRSARAGWQRYLYLSAIQRFLRDAPSVDVHIVTQEAR